MRSSDKKFTKEDVLRIAKEENIEFIRLQFVDIFGMMKNVAVTANELEKALENKIMFDGSSIEGFVRIEESDMCLYPDPSTFTIIPWYEHKIARLICDIYYPDKTPFEGSPRYILQKAVNEAREIGYEFYLGPECEFFIFQNNPDGSPSTKTLDNASYFDLGPIDLSELVRIDMVANLQKMGFKIEASHHETAPGQHEIDFKYSDAISSADNITTLKNAVKVIAQKHGLHATFMPKPVFGTAGSGMHCNMSLFKNGENAFYDSNDEFNLSQEAYYFLGGLLKHAKGMAAITNPIVNSYKRLVSGYEAPVYIAWSASNRSPLIRVPNAEGESTRIELRNPDGSCNPYLAFAVMLRAGLDGIKNKILPPKPLQQNIYKLSKEEREHSGLERLPENLYEAVCELRKDKLIIDTLGEHIFSNFVKAKRIEWNKYKKVVHPWEVDNFIKRY